TTHVIVVSGRTGGTIYQRDDGPSMGQGFLLPVGDATHDGVPDLLWQKTSGLSRPGVCAAACTGAGPVRFDAELIDGATRRSVWTAADTRGDLHDAVAVPLQADVSGDRAADVLVFHWRAGRFDAGVMSGGN